MLVFKRAISPVIGRALENNRSTFAMLAMLIACFVFAPQSLQAQTARITGLVTDNSGAVVTGANVTIENVERVRTTHESAREFPLESLQGRF